MYCPSNQRDLSLFPAYCPRHNIVILALVVLLGGCSPDDPSGPLGPKVSVCHVSGSSGAVTDIFQSELAEHRSHGDYVTRLEVDRLNATGDSIHFTRMTDALAVARAGRVSRGELEKAACRITISAAPGTLRGSTTQSSDPSFELFPLVIDVPDITLKGALKIQVDPAGRATGVAEAGDVTTFTPVPALAVVGGGGSQQGVSEEIIVVNAHPNGSKGNGAVIEGFVFQSGRAVDATTVGGQGVLSMRVIDLVIRGNRFEGGFTETLDLRASSAIVERNHLSGLGGSCDICLAGPGAYIARDNRVLGKGGIPGITVVPAVRLPVPAIVEQFTLPAAALVTATLTNNEVKGHVSKPVGAGLRVEAVGGLPMLSAQQG